MKFFYFLIYEHHFPMPEAIASCSDVIASSLDAIVSRENVIASSPDAIVSRADIIASSSDAIVSRADVIASSPDAIVSHADVISWLSGIIALILKGICEKVYLFTGIEKASKREL